MRVFPTLWSSRFEKIIKIVSVVFDPILSPIWGPVFPLWAGWADFGQKHILDEEALGPKLGGPAKVPNSYRAATASSDFTCTAGNKFTDEKRTFLKTVLLPQSKELLSNALTVSDADQAPGADSSMTPFAQCFNSPSTSLPGECTWDAIDNTKTFKDADFVLYIIARPTDTGVIAWATTLVRDPVTRRPLVGVANFNPEHLTQPKCPDLTNCLYDEDCSGSGKCSGNFHSQLGTAIHEIVHALGFSSSSWGQFKDLDEDKVIDRKTKLDGTTRTFVITPNVSKIKKANAVSKCSL